MMSFADLRARSENLAGNLPSLETGAGFKTTVQHGATARQKSGQGEDFWQYRPHNTEDGVHQIDWRRSATGDDLFIRQHELQSAKLMSLWVDPSSGFGWKSDQSDITKSDAAKIMLTALAIRFTENGDLINVIGADETPRRSHQLVGPLLNEFLSLQDAIPTAPVEHSSHIILASDFYTNFAAITDWVFRSSDEGRTGILLQVTDPAERQFDYQGRVRFSIPGLDWNRIIGRAETLKDDYLERFHQRQAELAQLCKDVGWHFIHHASEAPNAETAFEMLSILAAGQEL